MNNHPSSQYIQAVVVNHNTSQYTELMLRSLFVHHPGGLDLGITVLDNGSQDERGELEAYARQKDIPIVPSGYGLQTKWNSHGEILRKFVLDHPDCRYYLFLDADTCFIQDDTLNTMVGELKQESSVFGISPRLSSNGENEIEPEYRERIYTSRLHPCCALVKNTPIFQRVVETVGLSCVHYLWAHGEEYVDTFELASRVMKTHGCRHNLSSKMVLHFFSVSYEWEAPAAMKCKAALRDKNLEKLREIEAPVAEMT